MNEKEGRCASVHFMRGMMRSLAMPFHDTGINFIVAHFFLRV